MKRCFSRVLKVVICICAVLLPNSGALGQQFLPPDVMQAKQVDAAKLGQIKAFIQPHLAGLVSGQPKRVSAARVALLRPLGDPSATPVFLEAFSKSLTSQLAPATKHKAFLVRLNTMILLSAMVDDGSKALVDAGLADPNAAVQRWAMEGLRRRVQLWRAAQKGNSRAGKIQQKIDAVAGQVTAALQDPSKPHLIVVTPGLMTLLEVDTPASRLALASLINGRVQLHADNTKLSYVPEQVVLQYFAPRLATSRPFDKQSAAALGQAVFRHASVILTRLQSEEDAKLKPGADTLLMLSQSFQALGQLAAGAGKAAPGTQATVTKAILERDWDELSQLLHQKWSLVLRAAPFGLTEQDLAANTKAK